MWLSSLSRAHLPRSARPSQSRSALVAFRTTLVIAQGVEIFYLSAYTEYAALVVSLTFVIQLLAAVLAGHLTKVLVAGSIFLLVPCVVPTSPITAIDRQELRGEVLVGDQPQAGVEVIAPGGSVRHTDRNGAFTLPVTAGEPLRGVTIEFAGQLHSVVFAPAIDTSSHVRINLQDLDHPVVTPLLTTRSSR